MLKVEECVLILLAAGKSERFGDIRSKLDQDFLGKPLGLHVAVALEDMPFQERLAVIDGLDLHYDHHGFTVIHNPDRDLGMSSSVKLGVTRAVELGAKSVLIALADMPRVTAAHLYRVFDASQGADTIVASSDGCDPKPPALFGAGQFDCLLALDGGTGARDLVKGGRHVVTAPAELIDVDTVEELERLRALVHDPQSRTR
ncbi:nucleotidyltransferase family protein [Sphingomonas bacterium]|uniref:nucleotidyltransferase family protein n=1 Tax=Sphingomonas bacterium TaxID=1895847 RepID=UPI0015774587|nr:nucleotidyltransferase family protein [Sphingomonas bacterium]